MTLHYCVSIYFLDFIMLSHARFVHPHMSVLTPLCGVQVFFPRVVLLHFARLDLTGALQQSHQL